MYKSCAWVCNEEEDGGDDDNDGEGDDPLLGMLLEADTKCFTTQSDQGLKSQARASCRERSS